MAANTSEADDADNVVIYVMPQRIQKKMLQDIKDGAKRTKLRVSEKYGKDVTHIVTQYPEQEQVLRQLERDGAAISDDTELDTVKVVSLAWLSACLKAGKVVLVEDRHKVKCKHPAQTQQENTVPVQGRPQRPEIPAWACQRVTPLKHFNHKFTDALEILEKNAEFHDEKSDYARALAFRRASCVLKSLPFPVERLNQVKGLKDIGGHALKVIQSILEDGFCAEVQDITNEWFTLMKEFTSVFGVGPATAKKWIDKGWKSIRDVTESDSIIKDERVVWGLAFHEDLTSAVSVEEAGTLTQLVKAEAEKILPGVMTTLVGGFRRGKSSGHDVDILLTHPSEGKEKELLPALLQALQAKDLVLMGRMESSTYSPDVLMSDSKLVSMRGQLDHFEKWLGICRFEKAWNCSKDRDHLNTAAVGSSSTAKVQFHEASDSVTADKTNNSDAETGSRVAAETEKPAVESAENEPKNSQTDTGCEGNCDPHPKTSTGKHKTQEDSKLEPTLKRQRTCGERPSPRELAASERSWRARRVDLIVAPYSQYYYALVGWTGNKHFNRDLRRYAQNELNRKLTSHGLWDFTEQRAVPARSEKEVFDNLKLDYRKPSDRNC